MENYKLVYPEHLNHNGFLFGGNLLKWIDEMSWIAAMMDFPGSKFVTIALDDVEFRKSVKEGSVLRFDIKQQKIGNTSVTYKADVYKKELDEGNETLIFSTHITFVNVDDAGNKKPIKP